MEPAAKGAFETVCDFRGNSSEKLLPMLEGSVGRTLLNDGHVRREGNGVVGFWIYPVSTLNGEAIQSSNI